jgi:hypothetical protein
MIKVWIGEDEYYPFRYLKKYDEIDAKRNFPFVEIDADLYKELEKARKAFDKFQDKLEELSKMLSK